VMRVLVSRYKNTAVAESLTNIAAKIPITTLLLLLLATSTGMKRSVLKCVLECELVLLGCSGL
jgi:hypothetical protein